ncbi:maleylpyruvate isomerase family mycothiol-dependent enzyme [Lentzea sp. NPDC006480]|uniref:maleylpyruvate isomerase family mycothiol-dependent enzyme n=1 Tax=Lentzea sp. NPDC006480 TaxID=3157176 RepID=UPI00339F6C37
MLNYGLDMSELDSWFIVDALVAEGEELDALVSARDDWTRATPATGWTIAHQIAHLAAADADVVTAIRTPDAFDPVPTDSDVVAAAGAAKPRAALLEEWRAGRAEVASALYDIEPDRAFPWIGAEVTAQLMAPLRLMETWAHGQDIYDALGTKHPPTARLQLVAYLGVAGLGLSFHAAGLPFPEEQISVELTGPEGELWSWGPDPYETDQRIQGSAEDFCLLVTRRRRRAETRLTAVGEDADTWLGVARVFL